MYFFLQIALERHRDRRDLRADRGRLQPHLHDDQGLNFALGMWVMLGGMLTYSLQVQYGVLR